MAIRIFTRRPRPSTPEELDSTPITTRATRINPAGCLVPFFGLFLVVGLFVFYQIFLRPMLDIRASQSWVETPCVVLTSDVRAQTGGDSTTYSVAVHYRYTFHGQEYQSTRYDFMRGSSGGRQEKAEAARRYQPGQAAVCYVNPNNPSEAVLQRGFPSDLWFGLIPLSFVFLGMGGMYYALRRMGSKATPGLGLSGEGHRVGGHMGAGVGATAAVPGGPVELAMRSSPWKRFLALAFFTLFWNGIVSVFVVQVVRAWMRPNSSGMEKWFLPVFLIPFVLIGLVILGATGQSFLAIFNPRIRLRLLSADLHPGARLDLEWKVDGRVERLQRLQIHFEGREEVTFQRGTRTHTDTEVFAKLELANVTQRADMRHGRAQWVLPAGMVPTFQAPHNKVIWALHVTGQIPKWPDVDDEFIVTVRPDDNEIPRQDERTED